MRILLMLILAGWISLWTYYYVCWHQGHCGDESASDLALRTETVSQLIFAGEDLEVGAEENIKFARSQAIPIIPNTADTALSTLKNYLNEHEDEGLLIIGLYDDTETNNSLLPNLGMARAEAFKTWLNDFGIDRQQLFVNAQENINLNFQRDTLMDGLLFEITDDFPEENKLEEEEVAALEEMLKNTSQNLYFETGETSLQVNDEVRQYISQLKLYLSHQKEATVALIGHTDNVGDAQRNLDYGLDRAEFTRDILTRAGIARVQIVTDTRGESEPIAGNDTEAGRSQNRRVEIKLN
ncbi:OOP family OmpA-OmpF porin [Catalinimonas alkaloidigena]|uniref:OmpA family protein n=1 Tax=Catalinimonas alkaloidigena TaxID=1075417 RepID=UPI002405B216|nr:OmpA family protein [Catalinimonas alkaloidigena]MDF9798088.1 OOP family OmpA-OmpF porin [Catalinimonas alkaloidigena]